MKIIFLSKFNIFNNTSAFSNRYRSLIEGLVKQGVNIECIITDGFQSKIEKETWLINGVFNNIEYKYIFKSHTNNIWVKRIKLYLFNPIFSKYAFFKINKYIKKNPEAIIWGTYDINILKIIKKAKTYNNKTFIEISEFSDVYKNHSVNFLQRFSAKKTSEFFEQKVFHSLNCMALMTKTLLLHYSSFPKPMPKLIHLPMTVDLGRFDLERVYNQYDGLKKPYIAFIGDMNNFKDGVDILISSFAKIADKFKYINLYLFGFYFYDLPGHLNQIKTLGLETRIEYRGSLKREFVPDIMMNASLLVLSRPDSKQAQGGFPTKLGEYLSSGNPVCVTKVGEIPDYLEDGISAYFAEPGSVESFADAMQRALSNPEEAKIVGINGRKVAEKYFNKDIQSKLLYEFFTEIVFENKTELKNV